MLPAQEFSYGIKNRPSTPIKTVINYEYSNKAEEDIRRSYSQMIVDRQSVEKFSPKTTKYFVQKIENKKKEKSANEMNKNKDLYKIKKFLNVESKLKENLKNFKTYLPSIFHHKNRSANDNGLESLINKVEDEIKALENKSAA